MISNSLKTYGNEIHYLLDLLCYLLFIIPLPNHYYYTILFLKYTCFEIQNLFFKKKEWEKNVKKKEKGEKMKKEKKKERRHTHFSFILIQTSIILKRLGYITEKVKSKSDEDKSNQ